MPKFPHDIVTSSAAVLRPRDGPFNPCDPDHQAWNDAPIKASASASVTPTKVTVRNADNRVAGTTTYSNVKLNTDIDDELFKF